MKVSHECPISILSESRFFNDFDYALVHLFDEIPEYRDYYKRMRTEFNRDVLLDNSIFELGTAFDADEFYKKILWLEPTMYIVPDVLENHSETINNFISWKDKYYHNIKDKMNTKAIGAVQGKRWSELVECYKFMAENADMIAISFDFSYYDITANGSNLMERLCNGRKKFINDLIINGIWDWEKDHHLLGCALPQEFKYYKNISNIVSCDTSNPIVAAIHNVMYNGVQGLDYKIKTKLVDLIHHSFTPEQLDIVKYNTSIFKQIAS
jgi:hypothetical protein